MNNKLSFPIQNYFNIILFILMLTTFLPIVYVRLPAYIGSHHFWTILWGVSLLFLKPKVFFQKLMLLVILNGIILFIMLRFFWVEMDDTNVKNLWVEYYQIAVGCSIFTYFHVSKDYISFAKLVLWVLIFIVITSILTIFFYTQILETTERIQWNKYLETVNTYGFAGYGMSIVLMSIISGLIYFYKNKILHLKYIWIFVIFIVAIALIRIQLLVNIILAVLLMLFSLINVKNRKITIVILSFIGLVLLLIPKSTYIIILQRLSVDFAFFKEISFKLKELAVYIEFGERVGPNQIVLRAERYTYLFRTFQEHSLMGCFFMEDSPTYKPETYHVHWMHKIVITGIIFFLFYIQIFIRFIKENLKNAMGQYQYFFILSIIAILMYGVFKAIVGRECWYMFFVILPGMYYLPLLNKKSNIIEEKKNN